MRYFIDIEASALDGYPIEIAWVDEDGETESKLIRPLPSWTVWDWRSEAMHGITFDNLQAHGEPVESVAASAMVLLRGTVWSDNHIHDSRWLDMLTEAAGLPSIPVFDVREVWATELIGVPDITANAITDQADADSSAIVSRRHRAGDDSRRLWLKWRRIIELVREL